MSTASKALISFCALALGGTVLVIGPDGLRRLLPGAPQSDVTNASRQDGKVAATAEPKAESKAEAKPAGDTQAASSTPAAPAPPAAPSALEETRQATAALADLAPPQAPSAASQTGPRFDVARIDPDGVAVIAGQAAPGAKVELLRGGETLDSAVADGAGQFVMTPPKLPPGQYELTLRAKAADGTVTQSSQSVPVALNETAAAPPHLAAVSKDAVVVKPKDEAKADVKADVKADARDEGKSKAANAAARSARLAEAPTGSITPQELSRLVARGDSLWAISRRIYGDGARYARIFNANRDKIHNPDLIYPGQTFVLPKQ
jgi:nucleoid-associated protein YgaU